MKVLQEYAFFVTFAPFVISSISSILIERIECLHRSSKKIDQLPPEDKNKLSSLISIIGTLATVYIESDPEEAEQCAKAATQLINISQNNLTLGELLQNLNEIMLILNKLSTDEPKFLPG